MSTKKIMGIIALCAVVGIALFALVIYLTVKTKTKNISKHKPFTEWVGQTVTLGANSICPKSTLNPTISITGFIWHRGKMYWIRRYTPYPMPTGKSTYYL